jgi:hypothetical protein
MTISLRCDPATGKKDIIVKLHSDPDSLPMEHEQQHRALVDKLIEGGVLKASEAGKVVVERQDDVAIPAKPEGKRQENERKAQHQS